MFSNRCFFALVITIFMAGTCFASPSKANTAAHMPSGATSHYANVNGTRLHYLEMGKGPLVILMHGWPQTSYAWHETMAGLSDRFRVIAPDMRGTGLSTREKSGYDKKNIAKDIASLIDHLGEKNAIIVGHDMGGKAAYVMAHLYPEAVNKLVLVDCLLPGTENTDALRGGAWHYGFHMAEGVPEMLTMGRERDYIRTQIKAWSYNKDAISEDSISEYARHYAAPGGMTPGFNYYRALKEDAALAATFEDKKLLMPVLAIAGRHSANDRLAKALEPKTDNLKSVIIEDSGHFVAEEAPEAFIKNLRDFLIKP
jgi:pimeloyl-ACP methyl ester carboxylesterase